VSVSTELSRLTRRVLITNQNRFPVN